MTQNNRRHIVIVGGGFAGITAARELMKSDVQVTLIDRTNHHLFQPLLYQVATAALSPGDIAVPIRSITGRKSGIRILMGEVTDISSAENILKLKDGRTVSFDRLILAPGSRYNYFGNDEWSDHAPGLKSIADALNVRERILLSLEEAEQLDDPKLREPYLTFVVIGGGPTGVEMAGAIAEISGRKMMRDYSNISNQELRIYLVEALPQILNGYPDPLPGKALKTLEEMGVKVLLEQPVSKIESGRVHLNEDVIVTPNIIWAAGVVASPLLKSLGAEQEKSGRVKVNPDLSVPGSPDIYVIGDAAWLLDENGKPVPALAPVAIQQGRYVGRLLSRKKTGTSAYPAFHYKDKGTMATIGRAKAVADIRGWRFSGLVAWLMWSFIHIFFLIGFRNRVRVFLEWVWYYFTFKRGVRLITDRSHNLDNEDEFDDRIDGEQFSKARKGQDG